MEVDHAILVHVICRRILDIPDLNRRGRGAEGFSQRWELAPFCRLAGLNHRLSPVVLLQTDAVEHKGIFSEGHFKGSPAAEGIDRKSPDRPGNQGRQESGPNRSAMRGPRELEFPVE